MDKALVRNLLMPLTAFFLLVVALHVLLNWSGFFLNLSTEIVGIIITVAYVDYIVRRHESVKLAPADERIRRRIQQVATAALSRIRSGLGYGTEVLDMSVLETGDSKLFRAEVIRLGHEVLEPSAYLRTGSLDRKGWATLARHMQDAWQDADKMLQVFGPRLEPKVFALLVDVQDAIFDVLMPYTTFPDVMGVPENELPPNKAGVKPVALKRYYTKRSAEAIQRLSRLARELISWVDARE